MNLKFQRLNRYLHLGRVYLRFKLFFKTTLWVRLWIFSLFGCISCYTATQEKGWLVYITIWFKVFRLHLPSCCSFHKFQSPLSLSLSLNTHTHLNSKTHTKRLKLFTQYLQHNFSKFGQNHLLLDSSIDQYLPLRDWKASFFHKNSLVVIFLTTCYKTTKPYTWFYFLPGNKK